ncbi:hypothetical protein [Paractinoplanes ferrugineus]|uniref:hypothetical protein n=1 Tax=Paractinoplanes ferrugineus TaxID=113564 RepID=UPI001943DB53|nr:hypothetical protein [Actinoplanes ferrugineus]
MRRFDRETGEPVILMRMRPLRRWVLATAAAGGVALLFWWFYALRDTGSDGRGFFVIGTIMAASGAIGTIVTALTQDGFTVTPGRLRCGRVWVAGGNWRGGPADAAELVLQRRELDNITKLHLYATHRGGGSDEIFADDEDGRIALPFADWLSAVAHIPVRSE